MRDMTDLYNFSAHLKETVTPLMKMLGFKKKNLRFTRTNGNFVEEINIQKSQWNMANTENQFYVNLYVRASGEPKMWLYHSRIPNNPRMEVPPHYTDYYGDFSESFRSTFSEEEKRQIHEYMSATWWRYATEEKLQSLLEELCEILRTHLNPIFENLEAELELHAEAECKTEEARNKLNEIFRESVSDYCV